MNVVLKLFALQPGRHSPVEALVGLGLRVAKSGRFPFLSCLLSSGNGPAWFIAGANNGFTLASHLVNFALRLLVLLALCLGQNTVVLGDPAQQDSNPVTDESSYTDNINILIGDNSNNILYGGKGNDRIDGRGGNDTLYGGNGADVYLFGKGSGHDNIYNFAFYYDNEAAYTEADTVLLNAGVRVDDIILHRHHYDLFLRINGADDSLRLQNYFDRDGAPHHVVQNLEFADGTTLSLRALSRLSHSEPLPDELREPYGLYVEDGVVYEYRTIPLHYTDHDIGYIGEVIISKKGKLILMTQFNWMPVCETSFPAISALEVPLHISLHDGDKTDRFIIFCGSDGGRRNSLRFYKPHFGFVNAINFLDGPIEIVRDKLDLYMVVYYKQYRVFGGFFVYPIVYKVTSDSFNISTSISHSEKAEEIYKASLEYTIKGKDAYSIIRNITISMVSEDQKTYCAQLKKIRAIDIEKSRFKEYVHEVIAKDIAEIKEILAAKLGKKITFDCAE